MYKTTDLIVFYEDEKVEEVIIEGRNTIKSKPMKRAMQSRAGDVASSAAYQKQW